MQNLKHQNRLRRKKRIRAKVSGTAERPRLSVACSLTAIRAQLIDDTAGKTLASVTSTEVKKEGGKNIEIAKKVGELVAEKAKTIKITTVVFDRSGRKYHGRIKALADSARAGGLIF